MQRRQDFRNDTNKVLDIWVELNPDLYRLQPGDEMQIIFDDDERGLCTVLTEDGLQIYLQNFDTAVVTVNGEVAKPL